MSGDALPAGYALRFETDTASPHTIGYGSDLLALIPGEAQRVALWLARNSRVPVRVSDRDGRLLLTVEP